MRKEEGRDKGRQQERREMIQRCDVLTVCACVEWGADGLAQGVVERAERGIIGGFMTVCVALKCRFSTLQASALAPVSMHDAHCSWTPR